MALIHPATRLAVDMCPTWRCRRAAARCRAPANKNCSLATSLLAVVSLIVEFAIPRSPVLALWCFEFAKPSSARFAVASLNRMAANSAVLRDMVASINACDVLSPHWIENVDRLQAISSEAINSQSTASARAPAVAVTTLWDRDELAVRFLLEEGKLNLCLRLLSDYQEFIQRPRLDETILGAQIVDLKGQVLPLSAVRSALDDFEFYMGLLLSCALRAPEAVQTLDISLLVTHIASVFKYGISCPELFAAPDIARKQVSVCFLYLRELFKYADCHSGDRIMQLVQQHEVGNCIATVLNRATSWPKNILAVACSCVSALMSTEQYCTHPQRYLSPDCEKMLLGLRKSVVSVIFSTYFPPPSAVATCTRHKCLAQVRTQEDDPASSRQLGQVRAQTQLIPHKTSLSSLFILQ